MYASPELALEACPPSRARRAAIAIPDGTRDVDVVRALLALRAYCDDARVIVGLGLHRPMHQHELVASPFPLVQHDPDDTRPTTRVNGIPGHISRHVDGCDALWTLGIVELHQYAGFSGGHKGAAVGLGGRATIDALHHRDRVTAPGVTLGNLDGNPFRDAVDGLGRVAGCSYALNVAAGRWLGGEPGHVLREAAASLDCWWDHHERYPSMVLRVPPHKAVNFYQASRAATYVGLSARPPLLEGATLYLEAGCPEGLGEGSGERAFAEAMAATPPPWGAYLDNEAPVGGGTQRAVMLALLLRRYRLVVTGCKRAPALAAVGLRATSERVRPPGALVVDDPFGRVPRLVISP
mgnify:CR=1 FL=1